MARRRRNRSVFRGEPNGLQPGDEVGNRLPKAARQTVPDDIGNRREDGPSDKALPDDLGNRVDINPTHEHSGALTSVDGRKRRRRKGVSPQVRIGRYVLGGVNPMTSLDSQRAAKAQDAQSDKRRGERSQSPSRDGDNASSANRRSRRFFDFNDDDRYSYKLQSDPEEKRALAENTVQSIVTKMGREATCAAQVLPDGSRPKVLVTISESGPSAGLPDERKPEGAEKPLFAIGNSALMSINYIANKIVNRFPNDRIRLAILPKTEEEAYLEALSAHQAQRPPDDPADKTPSSPIPVQTTEDAEVPLKKVVKSRRKTAEATEDEAADAPAVEAASADDSPKRTKKVTAKKAAANKATTKKTTTKKAAAKKVTKKKAAAKTTTKKVTKKAPAKATTTKKATKKATAKKAAAKKAPAKKASAKKATKKKIAKKKTGG